MGISISNKDEGRLYRQTTVEGRPMRMFRSKISFHDIMNMGYVRSKICVSDSYLTIKERL